MLLRNFERYLEVLEFAKDSTRRRFVLDKRDDRLTQGFFIDHDGALFGLGVSRGAIVVLLQNALITYGPEITTTIQECGEARIFTACQHGTSIASVAYTPRVPQWFLMEDEDEDVDCFVWIHNVLSSAERMAILIENNCG